MFHFVIQDSEKEATKQRISELEEMVIQLRDELKEKVSIQLLYILLHCLVESLYPYLTLDKISLMRNSASFFLLHLP